jgi:integrase
VHAYCAVEWGVIEAAPHFAKLKTQQPEIEFFDFENLEQLVDGARKAGPEVLALVLLGADAGLRRGEIIALEQTDVDLRRGQITIARSDWCGEIGSPKGGKTRRVPLTQRLADALQSIRHLRGPRALYQRSGELVTETTLRSWMERAERAGGLPVTGHIHILRHTFCSHLAMRGAPAKAIQELAGHADLSTTMRYMHLSPAVAQPGDPPARATCLSQPVPNRAEACPRGRDRGENLAGAGKEAKSLGR